VKESVDIFVVKDQIPLWNFAVDRLIVASLRLPLSFQKAASKMFVWSVYQERGVYISGQKTTLISNLLMLPTHFLRWAISRYGLTAFLGICH